MTELWLPIQRNPSYEVSDHGRVRPTVPRFVTKPVLKASTTNRGYLKVCLGRGSGPGAQRYVHDLVAEAFIPGKRPGDTVDHLDFDRTNNHVSNLRWLDRPTNSVRWKDRVNGKNVWETPDDLPPDDHVPMTPEEQHDYEQHQRTAGW